MRIGDCPADVDGQACGAALYADPQGERIRCRKCGTTWWRGQWMLLGRILRGEEKTEAVEDEEDETGDGVEGETAEAEDGRMVA
jgi:hypothetical protein